MGVQINASAQPANVTLDLTLMSPEESFEAGTKGPAQFIDATDRSLKSHRMTTVYLDD
jgi:hypothetical protein